MILPDAFLCESPRAICKTVSRTNKRAIHICFWPQIPLSCDLIRPVGLMTPHGAFNRISRSHKTPAFLLMLLLWVVDYQFILRETSHSAVCSADSLNPRVLLRLTGFLRSQRLKWHISRIVSYFHFKICMCCGKTQYVDI